MKELLEGILTIVIIIALIAFAFKGCQEEYNYNRKNGIIVYTDDNSYRVNSFKEENGCVFIQSRYHGPVKICGNYSIRYLK